MPTDLAKHREALAEIFSEGPVTLEEYLEHRTAQRRQQINDEDLSVKIQEIQEIKESESRYVIIPSAEHIGEGDARYKARDTDVEVARINNCLEQIPDLDSKKYFYINNQTGDSSSGHWDLFSGKSKKKRASSANDSACGCYTVIQILGISRSIAPKLSEVLEKLEEFDRDVINGLLEIKKLKERLKAINEADPGVLRRFVKAAILNSNPENPDLASQANSVLQSRYQLELEELEKAFRGLGIPYLEMSYLTKIAEPLDEREVLDYQDTIIKRFAKEECGEETHQDELRDLKQFFSDKKIDPKQILEGITKYKNSLGTVNKGI